MPEEGAEVDPEEGEEDLDVDDEVLFEVELPELEELRLEDLSVLPEEPEEPEVSWVHNSCSRFFSA